MSFPTVANLREEAASLGLQGDSVTEFIYRQQNLVRDERAAERELERLAMEERQRIRDHELEVLRINQTSQRPEAAIESSECAARPKLPMFKEGDDIKSFIIRFERMADLLSIKKENWAVRLGAVLSGRAVDIFASLPPELTKDYDQLKKALLIGYNKTPETYRKDFRNARIGPNETYAQFSSRLSRHLDYWVDSVTDDHSYDSLRKFILIDQFLASVSVELRLFIKENNPSTLARVVELADNWSTARGAYPRPQQPNKLVDSADPHHNLRDSSMPTGQPLFPPLKDRSDTRKDIKCYSCGLLGHVKSKCPQSQSSLHHFDGVNHKVNFCLADTTCSKFMESGTVNGSHVSTILRDTGCSCVIVSETVIPDADTSQSKLVALSDFLGRVSSFPVVRCYIKCPFLTGWVDAVLAPIKFCSVLVGNVVGVSDNLGHPTGPDSPYGNSGEADPEVCSVVTRSSGKPKLVHPLVTPNLNPLDLTAEEFRTLQTNCSSLADIKRKVGTGEVVMLRDGSTYQFVLVDGLMYRKCLSSSFPPLIGKLSLVTPEKCRNTILEISHESPIAGHFSHRKTESKIRETFFWPTLGSDVRSFCRSCDKCQRISSKGRVKRAPLVKTPVISEPFSRVSIDLVGPLSPSEEGHRFILTLIDHGTGFPEAVPMKDIDTIAVSEALLSVFSRVGIPRDILSDRGPQFTSQLMGELHRLLGVKPLFSSPYHPMGNARVERLHSTLVTILRELCSDKPKQWHRFIVPTLFALREVPSDRTGFSSFELLYGRQVRGPLAVLRDLWTDTTLPVEERHCYQYVLELRDKLENCSELAVKNADKSVANYKTYFDLKSQDRRFSVGDEVLILLPDETKKLLVSWKGPFPVLERMNRVNYIINENGKAKLYHINLLKKYYRRAIVGLSFVNDEVGCLANAVQRDPLFICQSCIIEDTDVNVLNPDSDTPDISNLPDLERSDGFPEVGDLDVAAKSDLERLISDYSEVFSDAPGCTDTVVHDIVLSTSEAFRAKVYPVPLHLTSHFEREVDKLLELGIIQPSSSAYRNPVVLVKKPDNSYRLTLDTRAVNSVTVFHAKPSCSLEDELHRFTNSRYFTEMDLTKAYHQIKLTPYARQFTAFATHRGLMEFCRLPFGLVTACASYIRLMRIVLHGLENVSFYFDNILVFSTSWEHHLGSLTAVLDRLKEHGLTVKLSKCKFGFKSLNYLGFVLGHGRLEPQPAKVKAILDIPKPATKKTLGSFLGMISFYRKFIPNAASLRYFGPVRHVAEKFPRALTLDPNCLE